MRNSSAAIVGEAVGSCEKVACEKGEQAGCDAAGDVGCWKACASESKAHAVGSRMCESKATAVDSMDGEAVAGGWVVKGDAKGGDACEGGEEAALDGVGALARVRESKAQPVGSVPESKATAMDSAERCAAALRELENAVRSCDAGAQYVATLGKLEEAVRAAARQDWRSALVGLGRFLEGFGCVEAGGSAADAFYESRVNKVSEGWWVLVSLPGIGQEVAGRATSSMSVAEQSALKLTVQYLFQYLDRCLKAAFACNSNAV